MPGPGVESELTEAMASYLPVRRAVDGQQAGT
jgi:hypothetical protein